MDQAEIRKWLRKTGCVIQVAFGLDDWLLKIVLARLEDHQIAEVTADADRRRATITIDIADIADEQMLQRVFEHELLHVVASPWERYRFAVEASVERGPAYEALQELRSQVSEASVRQLESLVAFLRLNGGGSTLPIGRLEIEP